MKAHYLYNLDAWQTINYPSFEFFPSQFLQYSASQHCLYITTECNQYKQNGLSFSVQKIDTLL